MECKYEADGKLKITVAGFNRNIVECKSSCEIFHALRAVVLIETLWNVNPDVPRMGQRCNIVLIETLWNVNGIVKAAVV